MKIPFFFNDTATTEIYTLSLHDALPICRAVGAFGRGDLTDRTDYVMRWIGIIRLRLRSLFLRAKVDRELEEELRYHRERELEESSAAAPRSIAGYQQRKEECRDMRGFNLPDNLLQH